MLDEKMGKVAKGKKKKKKEKRKKKKEKRKRKQKKENKKVLLMFLRFYVEKAWNQKKLSIGD